MHNDKFQRAPGMGFNAREIEATPEPAPEPTAPAAPSTPVPQFGQRTLQDSDSKRARLLPGFDRVSDELGQGLAIDEAVRRAGVAGHLPIEVVEPVNIDAEKLRANLGAAVRSGDLDEASARRLWDTAFPGQDPGASK